MRVVALVKARLVPSGTRIEGHVAFQQHHDGSVVHYRDVAVRELD